MRCVFCGVIRWLVGRLFPALLRGRVPHYRGEGSIVDIDHLLAWCAHRWRSDEFDSHVLPFVRWYSDQMRDDPTLCELGYPMLADVWERLALA